jgi:hypothetical protein
MAEQSCADRAGDKADGVDAKGLQYPDQWVGFREIQLREDERGHENVEQEIVCLDYCTDCARDDCAAQLPAVLDLGKLAYCDTG